MAFKAHVERKAVCITLSSDTQTHAQSSIWVSLGRERCPGSNQDAPPRRRMFNGSCEDMRVQLLWRQQYHCTSQKPFGTKLPVISSAGAGFDLVALHDARASCHLTLQPKYTRTLISTEKLFQLYSTPAHLYWECCFVSVGLFCFSGNNIPKKPCGTPCVWLSENKLIHK